MGTGRPAADRPGRPRRRRPPRRASWPARPSAGSTGSRGAAAPPRRQGNGGGSRADVPAWRRRRSRSSGWRRPPRTGRRGHRARRRAAAAATARRPGTRRRRSADSAADLLGDVGHSLDRAGHDQQQIGEVDLAGPALGLFVLGVQLGDGSRVGGVSRPAARARCDVALRGGQHRLRPVDLGGEVAQFGAVDAQPQPGGRVADEPQRVVDDVGQAAAEDARREVLQLAQRRRVERAGLHPRRPERAQPGTQLARGPRGERDRQQLAGRDGAGAHGVGDAVGDRAGLAGAGAGEDADRAAHGLGRLAAARGRARPAPWSASCMSTDPASGLRRFAGTGGQLRNAPCAILLFGKRPMRRSRRPDVHHVHDQLVRVLRATEDRAGRAGIEYTEVDIERARAPPMSSWSVNGGNRTVPTVVFADGTAMTNPSLAAGPGQARGLVTWRPISPADAPRDGSRTRARADPTASCASRSTVRRAPTRGAGRRR